MRALRRGSCTAYAPPPSGAHRPRIELIGQGFSIPSRVFPPKALTRAMNPPRLSWLAASPRRMHARRSHCGPLHRVRGRNPPADFHATVRPPRESGSKTLAEWGRLWVSNLWANGPDQIHGSWLLANIALPNSGFLPIGELSGRF